jgi:predicted amidohydrolase
LIETMSQKGAGETVAAFRAGTAGARPDALSVVSAGCGPQPWRQEGGGVRVAEWLEAELADREVDLVVLSELAPAPFFPVSRDRSWLGFGETLDGSELAAIAAVARRLDCHILVGFAELDRRLGLAFNSAALVGPDGDLVEGRLCSGPREGEPAVTYRKVHLSENWNADPGVHEKYFFAAGDGFVVYETSFGTLAPLVCYDRSFPESWRAVRLAGARVVGLPAAFSRPERTKTFELELQCAAVQNGLVVVAACRRGEETSPGGATVEFAGGSCVVSPLGDVVARGESRPWGEFVSCTVDLGLLDEHDRTYHLLRDRRPDAYR